MNSTKLVIFLKEKAELGWRGMDDEKLFCWISFWYLKEFSEILGYDFLSEDGLDVNLRFGYIAFDLIESNLLEFAGIEPTDLLEKPING